jgi:uncharacterized protein
MQNPPDPTSPDPTSNPTPDPTSNPTPDQMPDLPPEQTPPPPLTPSQAYQQSGQVRTPEERAAEQRKLLSMVCHGSIFLSSTLISIIVPIVIMSTTEDDVVKDNAKESINFHINIYICGVVFAALSCLLIGIPLLILLWVATIVMPIIALVKCADNPRLVYQYPFIFRLV